MKKIIFIFALILLISSASELVTRKRARGSAISHESNIMRFHFLGSCKTFFSQTLSISRLADGGCLPITGNEDNADLNADVQCINVRKNRAIIDVVEVFNQKNGRAHRKPFVVSFRPKSPVLSRHGVYLRRPYCQVGNNVCNTGDRAIVYSCNDTTIVKDQKP